jgi:ATP-dependent Clp protease adaptor protein ClpS
MVTRKQVGPEGDAALAPEQSLAKPPPMYMVLLLNDDFTPMDFVVVVLEKFFGLSREQSTQVMLKVHREGKGACGVYPRDVAATKVEQVSEFSRRHQHPLACVMEEDR